MKKLNVFYSVIIVSVMLILLAGCGGTNDEGISDAGRSDIENGSDFEDEDDPEDIDLLHLRYRFHSYDLDIPFSQLYRDAEEEGVYLVNYITFRVFDENGDYQEGINTLDLDRDRLFPVLIEKIDDRYTVTSYGFDYAYVEPLITADKIDFKTKEKDLPDYYIHLGCGQTGFEEYAVVIKDGRIWDIQDHIDALPESPDTGFLDDIRETLINIQPLKRFYPIIFNMPLQDTFEQDYADDPDYKNNFAVIRAIEDAYESVLNGDIESTAVIYLAYRDGELQMCDYHIFRDTFKD